MEFKIEPCKTKATFSVKPNKRINLDIKALSKDFKPVKVTSIAGVFEHEGEEFIVQKYGIITFKTLKDKKVIEKIAKKIYKK
ncbi:hypothetical protein KY308_03900 [Candidatus Woesearchaeota archaeon]|nr:hypothetical protein [Candidatus Woesearchaeota archaeon]